MNQDQPGTQCAPAVGGPRHWGDHTRSRFDVPVALLRLILFAFPAGNAVYAQKLELVLLPDTHQIVAGEPLYVQVVIRNTTAEVQSVRTGSLQEWRLYLAKESENFSKVPVEAIERSRGPGVLVTVAPGGKVSRSFVWAREYYDSPTGASRPLFATPGRYRLKIETDVTGKIDLPAELKRSNDLIAIGEFVKSRTSRLESAQVTIDVSSGNDDDQEGRNLYTSDIMANWVDFEDGSDLTQIALLRRIIRVAPHSAFVDHSHMRLAEYFDAKSPRNMDANMAWDDDNVWLVPEVKAWTVARVLHHYTAVSERNPSLRARALYAAGAFAVAHSPWVPEEFDIDKLLAELEKHSQFADQLALPHSNAEKIRLQLRELQQAAPK